MSLKNNNKLPLLFRKSAFNVVELFFREPSRQFHLREVSKLVGLSTTAVLRAIHELEVCGLVIVEKTSVTSNITVNQESRFYLYYKRIFNLYLLGKYGVVELIAQVYRAKTVVLFGSYSKGEDTEQSDIDFLVLTSSVAKPELNKLERICEKKLGRKLSIIAVKSLDSSANEFINSVANGVVLHGYLKVV